MVVDTGQPLDELMQEYKAERDALRQVVLALINETLGLDITDWSELERTVMAASLMTDEPEGEEEAPF